MLVTGILIGVFFTKGTIDVVRKAFRPSLPRRNKEKDENKDSETLSDKQESPAEYQVKNNKETKNEPVENAVSEQTDETDTYEDSKPVEIELEPVETTAPLQVETSKPISNKETTPAPVETNKEEEDENEYSEPAFEINNERKEEDEEYRGNINQPYNPRLDLEHYKFPTLDLLNSYGDHEPTIDMEEQNANKNRIIQVLRSFGIEISSIKASVGPTITLYEITPAEGVRISKIRNLEDDIALSLSALGIRIIAPIPGKGTIGIEVPNANPRIVPMSSILASKKFQETTFDLPVALGKTITNEVFMVDLTKAPHMLVAGATGQGKSVGLNAIVTSLLYKKHPSELKFVIIDPKKVEFAIYAPIEKHFLAKLPDASDAIITDVSKVVQTLNSLCVEMDTC